MKLTTKLTMVLCGLSAIYWSGCTAVEERQVTARSSQYDYSDAASKPSSVDMKDANFDTFGRRWGTAEPAPAPKPVPAPAPVVKMGCSEATWGPIHMTKVMPAEASLGSEFMAELHASAMACVANAVIRDTVPAGASFVRSEPAAVVEGDQLMWKLGNLDSGEARSIKIWFRADKEGTLVNCASVSADPRVCAATVVGKPMLSISKTGPAAVKLGESAAYTVVVQNSGSAVARGVVVTDMVPDGLSSADGQKQLVFNVGDLAPGQSKTIPVTLRADKRGHFCNKVAASSSNAGKVDAQACTDVFKDMLNIEKVTTDKMLLIGKVAGYTIKVTNPGDRKQTGVVVTDTAAAGTTIEEAPGATINGNVATWNVGDVDVGAAKTFTVQVKSRQVGNFCDVANVASAQGASNSAQDCSTWEGVTGVLLEMIDDPDPIPVGDVSKYTIRVTNQGTTRAIETLNIVAVVPPELQLVPGTISDGGTISGSKITWPTVASLAPKAVVTHTYQAKGVKAGDARSMVQITTSSRQNPIEKFESTTVY